MMKSLFSLSVAAAALLASPALAQTVAITGGKVVIGDGSAPIEGGTVVLRDGKVVAAGSGVAVPAGAQVVDASGRWVTPGLFAGFSRLGLVEVEAVNETNDSSASRGEFSAAIDVTPAINPKVSAVAVNRAAGITRAVVAPIAPAAIFAGMGAVIDLGDDYNAVTRARAFQFVELGETGSAKAGGSRASAFLEFRNALIERARSPMASAGCPRIRTMLCSIARMPQRWCRWSMARCACWCMSSALPTFSMCSSCARSFPRSSSCSRACPKAGWSRTRLRRRACP